MLRLFAILVCLLMPLGCIPAPSHTAVPQQKVVCFGDSITYATDPMNGLLDGTRWVDRLAAYSPYVQTVNAGRDWRAISGPGVLDELRVTLRRNPDVDVVIIALGTNDLIGNRPGSPARATVAMEKAIRLTRQMRPQAEIVICAPTGIDVEHLSDMHINTCAFGVHTARDLSEIATAYQALAAREQVRFVNLNQTVSRHNFLDGVHPSPHGHTEIAQAIWSEISDLVDHAPARQAPVSVALR